MARKLRVLVAGGWYHVANRGNRREAIFRTDDDRRRFLGRLSELPPRYRVEVHAYVLMDNHYHLLLRTRDANLSEAIRWLQVTYSAMFNWANGVRGHVFQGRFKSVLIEDVAGVSEVARYVHLNPVRTEGLGLGKADRRRAKVGGVEDPGRELVARRLRELEAYPWSSWRAYGGAEPAPGWLTTEGVGAACGGRTRKERARALRDYTEGPVRQGGLDRPWDRVIGGVVLGSEEYASAVLGEAAGNTGGRSGTGAVADAPRVPWADILAAAERIRGRKWKEAADKYGEWLRDGVLYVATRRLGYRLGEAVREAGGVGYGAAAQGVRRFALGLAGEDGSERKRFVERLVRELEGA
ncbi:MAG: transposase [Verrucomicrobiae bacterium]|nr:transposase [Verrucomicrobiae bacterium]